MSALKTAMLVLLVLPPAARGAAKSGPPTPSQAISAFVRWQAPKGWRVEEYANGGGADPVVAYVAGTDRIELDLYGSPGSAYKTPGAFLKSPAATSLGRKADRAGVVEAAGKTLDLWRRRFSVDGAAPHVTPPGQPLMGTELFFVLPLSEGRFVVLALSRETPAPDPKGAGEKAWKAFLKSLKPTGRKA